MGLNIKRQLDSVEAPARRGAETVTTMLVHFIHHGMSEHDEITLAPNQAEPQSFAEDFYAIQQRNIVFVDTDKKIIADTIPPKKWAVVA